MRSVKARAQDSAATASLSRGVCVNAAVVLGAHVDDMSPIASLPLSSERWTPLPRGHGSGCDDGARHHRRHRSDTPGAPNSEPYSEVPGEDAVVRRDDPVAVWFARER